MIKYCFFLLFLVSCICRGYGQSEVLITYNTKSQTPVGSIIIPFDKKFTLQVPGCNTQNIKKVYAYQAELSNGRVALVPSPKSTAPVQDLEFNQDPTGGVFTFRTSHDTLSIEFPPLKPEQLFEVAVVRSLTGDNLTKAYALNEAIYQGDATAIGSKFQVLKKADVNNSFHIEFLGYDQSEYQAFYNSKLSDYYQSLHSSANYITRPFLKIEQVNYLEDVLSGQHIYLADIGRVARLIQENNTDAIFYGYQPVKYDNMADPTPAEDYATRSTNIKASMDFFSALIDSLDHSYALAKDASITGIRSQLVFVEDALAANKKFIDATFKHINDAMASDINLQEGDVLITSTIVKSVQTQGGNHFTMEFGLANIAAFNIENKLVYLPRPFYGINYYFRPIDKNTRKKDFPHRYPRKPGGPDYDIATERSFWQNFSVTVGLTFGAMTNTQFDNFFNNGILLAGGAYRIGKFFKVGTGVSLLKRQNKNPLISNKTAVAGFYINLSADIDLIQGVKDFTNLLFK
jgi:hypothetical protein